jgi:hypothetical protein
MEDEQLSPIFKIREQLLGMAPVLESRLEALQPHKKVQDEVEVDYMKEAFDTAFNRAL